MSFFDDDINPPLAYTIELAGIDLDRKDGPFRKSDPYLILKNGDEEVYRTEYVKQNLNPEWKRFVLDARKFGGHIFATISIECYDWDPVGKHDLIGTVDTTFCQLTSEGITEQLKSKKGKDSGKIQVKFSEVYRSEEEKAQMEKDLQAEIKNHQLERDSKYKAEQLGISQEEAKKLVLQERENKANEVERKKKEEEERVAKVFADYEAGGDPSLNDNETIRTAVRYGRVDLVKKLLADSRVDPSAFNNDAIRACSNTSNKSAELTKNYPAIMKLLLEDSRVDPNQFGYPLYFTCSEGNEELTKLLLAHSKIEPSAEDNNALRIAVSNSHKGCIKLLLDHPKTVVSSELKKELNL